VKRRHLDSIVVSFQHVSRETCFPRDRRDRLAPAEYPASAEKEAGRGRLRFGKWRYVQNLQGAYQGAERKLGQAAERRDWALSGHVANVSRETLPSELSFGPPSIDPPWWAARTRAAPAATSADSAAVWSKTRVDNDQENKSAPTQCWAGFSKRARTTSHKCCEVWTIRSEVCPLNAMKQPAVEVTVFTSPSLLRRRCFT
jgi:hypothetical protein